MPRLSKIGAAALAAFGWTGLQTVNADFLVVAGGGGAGSAFGGGGGAGGYRCSVTGESSGGGASAEAKLSLNPTQSYTVTVGAGGTGSTGSGTNGNDSVLSTITSTGGGYGGGAAAGGSGGSGGGAGSYGGAPTFAAAAGTANQGFAGGQNTGSANYGTGGGGGAGAVGGTGTTTVVGSGGTGVSSSITGSSVGRAGGGGGAGGVGFITTPGTASDGGGAGGSGGAVGTAGTANTGGGGGAGSYSGATWASGGQGGSGVVIISYVGAQQFGGGVVTSSGGNTIHTFNTSGTLSPLSSLTANFLVVAGGGGGGAYNGGGGGAGGLRSSVTNTGGGGSLESTLTIDTNSIYTVTVGAGGSGQISSTQSVAGSNSSFLSITSTGGGKGGGYTGSFYSASTGGSGGGAPYAAGGPGAAGTANQGFAGGNGDGSTNSGGGGGAGAVGGNATASVGGNGGVGVAVAISGTSTFYAGGGGGAGFPGGGGSAGTGGNGGGGNGGANSAGTSGTANTGGGGGGSQDANNPPNNAGGNGGSGVVIISYAGSTQQMAGGTVTVAGGNVIHTFTSSGYLTPIVLVNNSLRFRSSAGAYLNRTPSVASNRRTWTWSAWVKRSELSSNQSLFAVNNNGADYQEFRFQDSNTLRLILDASANNYAVEVPTVVWRDVSAWYHIVLAVDTTQTTSTNQIKIYVNGIQQTVSALSGFSFPAPNFNTYVNATLPHAIGNFNYNNSAYFNGYMTEINLIDGLALTPFSFGTTSDLGVWQPIRYGGSYGTNGFYLKFTDTTNTTTLGYDSSPNSNNWTTNNISLTAGSTYDSMTDVPTLTSATAANYATINPLDYNSTYLTLNDGNLHQTYAGVVAAAASRATMVIPTTGKYYWEVYINATGGGAGERIRVGITSPTTAISGNSIDGSATSYLQMSNGQKRNNSTDSTYGSGFSATQIIQVLYDATAGAIYFGQNDSYANGTGSFNQTFSTATAAFTGLSGEFMPCFVTYGGADIAVNFGQQPFTYTPPTGFVRLNTFNLPAPPSGIGTTASELANEYMDVVLYSGNNSTQNITVGFQPDMVWSKCRNVARSHRLSDAVRGSTKDLYPDTTDDEDNNGSITAFISTGFSLDNATGSTYNTSGENYVSWAWKANGAGSSNTDGTITSTVSASTTAGFSIVTWTGNGVTAATVGHGLGVVPAMIICKERSVGGEYWHVKHQSTASNTNLFLNQALGSTSAASVGDGILADLSNSTTFGFATAGSPGNVVAVNENGVTNVAYCFAQVAGYSAFGSYTGNGVPDGTFIFTGFRPKYIMIKSTSVESWELFDTSRSPYNQAVALLEANSAGDENTSSTSAIDILSNGFKQRNTRAATNGSGTTYIYMAFAENPFKYANAR